MGSRCMKRGVGLIVNPVAGMGGSAGLNGTDGVIYDKALECGTIAEEN
jgi:predicted polyphosphate/ATP-dependent NAD kinase